MKMNKYKKNYQMIILFFVNVSIFKCEKYSAFK